MMPDMVVGMINPDKVGVVEQDIVVDTLVEPHRLDAVVVDMRRWVAEDILVGVVPDKVEAYRDIPVAVVEDILVVEDNQVAVVEDILVVEDNLVVAVVDTLDCMKED